MKEIKAYIRTNVVAETVEALEEAGAPGITVVSVHPVGYGFEPNYFEHHGKDPLKPYPSIVRLELVCKDEDLERFVQIISGNSYTGTKGDGMIFIIPVENAISIRTGVQGEKAL